MPSIIVHCSLEVALATTIVPLIRVEPVTLGDRTKNVKAQLASAVAGADCGTLYAAAAITASDCSQNDCVTPILHVASTVTLQAGIVKVRERPVPFNIIRMFMYAGTARLILEGITERRTNLFMDEIYSVIRSFIYLMALPAFVSGRNIRFRVTPKDGRIYVVWQGVICPTVIFEFNLAAVVVATCNPYIVAWDGYAMDGVFIWEA